VQQVYKYGLDTNNGSGWTTVPVSDCIGTNPTVNVYSEVPVAEYVREFYNSSGLDQVYTPPTADRFYVSTLSGKENLPGFTQINDQIAYGAPVNNVGQSRSTARGVIKLKANGQKDGVADINALRGGNPTTCNNGRGNNRTTNLIV